jgi:hypothetical protein
MRLGNDTPTLAEAGSGPTTGRREAHPAIETLVHFGAGQCSELDAYLALKPEKLLLVEADPQLAAALTARTAQLPNVQVVAKAVAAMSGAAIFYGYHLPGTGGLHPATGLLQLFPGLKALEPVEIEALGAATLIEPLQLVAQRDHLLVIDLPGEELPVLQALWEAKQLHLFSQVKLHCGREPLYEGAEPAARILCWLQENGFDLLSEEAPHDPDFPAGPCNATPSNCAIWNSRNS